MREEEWLELLKSIAIGDQLALLHGELCVDDKKFHSGDFIRAEAGSVDLRVWTETGCTCVVMTSLKDTIL
jgi:hypothetical protein